MIKYAVDKWNKNRDLLRNQIGRDTKINCCDYDYIVRLVVRYILNNGYPEKEWNENKVAEVGGGGYQGTLLYLIPKATGDPFCHEYLMTYVEYGSCSCCDTLQSIQADGEDGSFPNESQVKDYMVLCKDLIQNMICPYNHCWAHRSDFDNIT